MEGREIGFLEKGKKNGSKFQYKAIYNNKFIN